MAKPAASSRGPIESVPLTVSDIRGRCEQGHCPASARVRVVRAGRERLQLCSHHASVRAYDLLAQGALFYVQVGTRLNVPTVMH